MSGPPRLSVSTSGPTGPAATTAPLPSSSSASGQGSAASRKPLGARTRTIGRGLYVANPDNSDDDGESPKSVVGTVGGGSSSSGGAAGPGPSRSPVTASSAGSSSSASMMMGRPGSHAAAIIAHSGVGAPSTAIPTIPAPQTTPLPHISTFASSSSMTPLPSSSLSAQSLPPFDSPQAVTGFAPQPPPQPERHLRRAFTNPSNDSAAMSSMTGSRPTQEIRTTSGTTLPHYPSHHPASPPRALPPLPSPNLEASAPSPRSTHSAPLPPLPPASAPPVATHSLPSAPPPPPYPPPQPPSIYANGNNAEASASRSSLTQQQAGGSGPHRTQSPEDVMISPTTIVSEGGRSFASGGSSESIATRARSGSSASLKRLLQVTMDNEQFTLVDITGMNTADAILERIFSKLRFRDEDHATLSLHQTEIGEPADPHALSKDELLGLCISQGDAKATLKFLVLQISLPGASSASVVPPVTPMSDAQAYRAGQDRRPEISPITTDLAGGRPVRTPSRHSKDGSMSSASEILERGGGGSSSDRGDYAPEEDWQGAGTLQRARLSQRMSGKGSNQPGRAGSSAIGGSRSPLTEFSTAASSPPVPTHPLQSAQSSLPPRREASPARSFDMGQPASPTSASGSQAYSRGNSTPTAISAQSSSTYYPPSASADAGPSRWEDASSLGLSVSDEMDDATRALIEQIQREEEEAFQREENRRRQELADEELARKEQQSERERWERSRTIDIEQRRHQQAQIDRDEQQAREFQAAEDRREQERRQEEQRRRTAQNTQSGWEADRRDRDTSRGTTFLHDRRALRSEWQQRADGRSSAESPDGSWALPALPDSTRPYTDRRQSDSNQYSTGSGGSTLDHGQLYTSPPSDYPGQVPSYSSASGTGSMSGRRPSGFPAGRYEEESHASDRLNDPRLQQITGRGRRPSEHARGRGHPRHPYSIGREDNSHGAALQIARSMDNLRPWENPPVSRPPFQGVATPQRHSATPQPGDHYHSRSPSSDWVQDGRYPDLPPPSQSAPPRAPPLQTTASDRGSMGGFMPFPVPSPHGTWDDRNMGSPTLGRDPGSARRPSYDARAQSPRPSSLHYDREHPGHPGMSPPITATLAGRNAHGESPNTARRPGGFPNDGRPSTATRPTDSIYRPSTPSTERSASAEYNHPGAAYGGVRRGSAADIYAAGPIVSMEDRRRASDSSANGIPLGFDQDRTIGPEGTWLAVPQPGRRNDSDTVSVAGTVSSGWSEATIRAVRRDGEEDSADTARAGDLAKQWNALMNLNNSQTSGRQIPEDDDEATLWLSGPLSRSTPGGTSSPRPGQRPSDNLRPSPSRPELHVVTGAIAGRSGVDSARSRAGLASAAYDSATESESEDANQSRSKAFAGGGNDQWLQRPEPEQLFEDLDRLFPKIDLDKPIVDASLSTPTTPASDSESVPSAPPVHPSRSLDPRLPQSPRPDRSSEELTRMPPPVHPARTNITESREKDKEEKAAPPQKGFNKSENRKSIRHLAQDWKRRTLRQSKPPAVPAHPQDPPARDVEKTAMPAASSSSSSSSAAALAKIEESKKPDRRKSSSMWGHRLQEITPSKMQMGQVQPTIPESPSGEDKSPTLTWVKGKLIGKGSYGRVYIALNVSTGEMMAVKQVELPATERDRTDRRQLGMVEALKSEIALLKDLYHPNIVQYLGCETSPEYISIFLEYVPGGTIATIYRNNGRFEEQLIKFFTRQILDGLAYLHGRHIWHRDLKGDNILVDAAGTCKISDFGISKQASDAYDSYGQHTNMKGSVFWMAPEVIAGGNDQRTYSGKVDIWSLGCVVIEMWSGVRPWGDAEQVTAMLEMFSNKRSPPLPPDIHLSPAANDFLNVRCLAYEPANRPVAKDLIEHAFIQDVNPRWTFAESDIGRKVAKNGEKKEAIGGSVPR